MSCFLGSGIQGSLEAVFCKCYPINRCCPGRTQLAASACIICKFNYPIIKLTFFFNCLFQIVAPPENTTSASDVYPENSGTPDIDVQGSNVVPYHDDENDYQNLDFESAVVCLKLAALLLIERP